MATTTLPPVTAPSLTERGPKIAATIGRIAIMLGVLALVGAWITQLAEAGLHLSQQHLFFDAIALTLLGIAWLVDAQLHARGI